MMKDKEMKVMDYNFCLKCRKVSEGFLGILLSDRKINIGVNLYIFLHWH